MWNGELPGRLSTFAERRGRMVRLRSARTAEWRETFADLSEFDSMLTHAAGGEDGRELLGLRERLRDWRFYDALRTDPRAPARRRRTPAPK